MSKGYSGLFEIIKKLVGLKSDDKYDIIKETDKDSDDDSYNSVGSADVRNVDEINVIDTTGNIDKLPIASEPNSVTKNYKNGQMVQERYYDENGDVYLDIDYTDHNNPKTHPVVPHQHNWTKSKDGKIRRSRMTNIKKKVKK